MTNLVDELRAQKPYDAEWELCERAADEIERLRAALQAVLDCDEKLDLHAYDYLHHYDEVRAMIKQVEDALRAPEQGADK